MDVTVAVPPDYLYFNKAEYKNGTRMYKGLVFDILKALCPECNYSYIQGDSFIHPETGVLALVANKKADMAVGPITMTYERLKYVDFLQPYLMKSILFLTPEQHASDRPADFDRAFQTLLWLTALITLLIYLIIFGVISWSNSRTGATESSVYVVMDIITHTIAVAVNQGISSNGRAKHKPSMIFLMTSLIFGSLILTTSYTAKLISFRVVTVHKYIKTLEELAEHQDYDVLVAKDSFVPNLLKEGTTKLHRELWNMVNKNYNTNMYSFDDLNSLAERIEHGKAAIFGSEMVAQSMLSKSCVLHTSEDTLFIDRLAFPVSKDFKLKDQFNMRLLKMTESGIIEELLEKHQKDFDGPPANCHEKHAGSSVTLVEVQGHMTWLAAGGLVAFVVFVVEGLYSRLHFRNSQSTIDVTETNEMVTVRLKENGRLFEVAMGGQFS